MGPEKIEKGWIKDMILFLCQEQLNVLRTFNDEKYFKRLNVEKKIEED